MCEEANEEDTVKEILRNIEKEYGFIPLVSKILSERPDLFIPTAQLTAALFEGKGDLEKKVRYLNALSAAVAVGAEHSMMVQMQFAVKHGATKNEIMETMEIGAYMAMSHAQSYAFRKFKEMYP
ncbi:MAG: carboxymuconolactone decarboxylase family protein [Methanomassiliicoccaceae archaeon]|nr:carboxymuconolactone decarboxylase family protein [Methanomassiliicoccaceae archaeon]